MSRSTFIPRVAPLLATLLAAAALFGTTHANADTRIVGGQLVNDGAYPFMAALLEGGEQVCGASIIDERWVLTAAHCVERARPSDISVLVGTNNLNSGGTRLSVRRIVIHPDYTTGTPDIALIELAEATNAPAIRMLEPGSGLDAPGRTATVIGWGLTTDNGNASPNLREVNVPIVADAVCREAYGNQVNSQLEICAGLAEGGRDSCNGDSGGPLFVRDGAEFVQAGIVSWGDGCALPNAYGVYARVSALKDWVNGQMGSTGSGGVTPPTAPPTQPPSTGTLAANFTAECAGRRCTFDASSSTSGTSAIEDYYWEFGDGGWAQGRRVNHTFEADGTYEVWLAVVAANGDYDERVDNISVESTTPTDAQDVGFLSNGETAIEVVRLVAGERAVVTMTTDDPTVDFDLFIEAPRNGVWTKIRSSAGPKPGAAIRFDAPHTGAYRVVVKSYRGAAGYTLSIRQ